MRVAALYDKWRGGFDCKAQRAVMVHHAVTVGCRLWFRFGTPALVAKRHGAFSSKIAATGSSLAPPTLLQLGGGDGTLFAPEPLLASFRFLVFR